MQGMFKKIFVLGRTGSGKSTVVRYLTEFLLQQGWFVEPFNDYPYLREMFLADTKRRQFRRTEHGGFEVIDPCVFTLALQKLEQAIREYHPPHENTILTVEFTSNHYPEVLKRFHPDTLRDACFLFVGADLQTCMNRASMRVHHLTTSDDYYVVDTVLLRHYPCPYMPLHFNGNTITLIENMEEPARLKSKVEELLPNLLIDNSLDVNPVPILAAVAL